MADRKINIDLPMNEETNFHKFYKPVLIFAKERNKIIIGEDYICRFCGETDRKEFKKENAHTIPEFTGNRNIFSKDECKSCNNLFSIYENELANHSYIMRVMFGIGKKNKSTPKYKDDFIDIKMIDGKLEIRAKESDKKSKSNKTASINFTIDKFGTSGKLNIPLKEYIPQDELEKGKFELLKEWILNKDLVYINNDDVYQQYSFVFNNTNEKLFMNKDPMIGLYKKKDEYKDKNIPTYSSLLLFGNYLYQIYLPYYEEDSWLNENESIQLLVMPELVIMEGSSANLSILKGYNTKRSNGSKLINE